MADSEDEWQFEHAQTRFDEVFERARSRGPQRVMRDSHDAVVVVAAEEFEDLLRGAGQPQSLVEFFSNSPFSGGDIEFERPRDPGRGLDF